MESSVSNRTLFEFNHDFAGEIKRNPTDFEQALMRYLSSGCRETAEYLERYGVRRFGMRHHSDAFSIDWGGNKAAEPETRKS